MKIKKLVSIFSAAALSCMMLAGCGSSSDSGTTTAAANDATTTAATAAAADTTTSVPATNASGGQVYYLNFKPEADTQWQALAKTYTKETGVQVTVLTAASGQYATTLKSELAKTDAPTLFQCSSPVGLKPWKQYCYDLKNSKLYGELTNDSFTLTDGNAVDGIAYAIESYGIIYNKQLLQKAGYTQDDIKCFADLK
jgi:raffinose/stachyose/melibiose transport system substrate-binding protein